MVASRRAIPGAIRHSFLSGPSAPKQPRLIWRRSHSYAISAGVKVCVLSPCTYLNRKLKRIPKQFATRFHVAISRNRAHSITTNESARGRKNFRLRSEERRVGKEGR